MRALRFSPSRLALGYIALSVLALALFAVPLWYGWRTNLSTFKAYVEGEELQSLVEVFAREGASGLTAAMASRAASLPGGHVMILADPSKRRLAGNLPAWPAQIPDAPGTYGLVIDIGGGATMRVVGSHVVLPDGYHLLLARESVLFHAFIERFWLGIGGAIVIVLVLSAAVGWVIRRGLLSEVQQISRTASAIVEGDLSRRLSTRGGSPELDALAHTVNGMLAQLASQNVRLESEIAVRRQAEQALQRAHHELEAVVEQRTAQLARANESLRLSEERYARAMEASDAGHWDWNVLTGEMFQSARMKQVLGFPPEARFTGREDFVARTPFHPDDRKRVESLIAATLESGADRYELEYRVELPTGETRWVRARGKVYRDGEGRAIRVAGSLTDDTDRKCAEEALRESEERYARAVEASDEGHWEVNISTGEIFVSARMNQIFGWNADTGFADHAEFSARAPFHPDDRGRVLKAVHAVMSGESERYELEYRIEPRPGEICWVRSRAKAFRDERGALSRLSGSMTDITDRKHAEDALRLSEERQARAMDAAGEGLWEWNLASDEMFVSARMKELLGIAPDEQFASRAEFFVRQPIHPDDRERVAQAREAVLSGASSRYEIEYRIQPRPGEIRWVSSRGKLFVDERGVPTRMSGSLSDITERRRGEEALADSEARFRSLTKLSTDFFWETDVADRFTSVETGKAYRGVRNVAWSKLGKTRWEIPHVSPDEAAWTAHRAVIAARRRFVDFGFSRIENGEERFYEHSGEPRFDAQGRFLGYRGVGRDVTDRKRAEEALRESEDRFVLAVAGSNDGIWDWDLTTGAMFLSERAQRLYGLEPGPTIRPRTEWREMVKLHPQDAEAQRIAVEDYLAGREPRYEGEWRVLHPDGTYRWVRIRGLCVRDESGRATRMAGSVSDVDQQKRAEEALRESEARFRTLTNLSSDWYWRQDEDLRFTYLSSEVNELAGYPASTSIGKRRWELPGLRPLSGSWAEHRAALEAREPFRDFEYYRVGEDGTARYISVSGAPIFDEHGRFSGYQGVGHSITERKRIEEALRLSEARYARAMEATDEGHWEWDVVTDDIFVSPTVNRIFGFPEDVHFDKRADFIANVPYHPDDLEHIASSVHAGLTGTSDRTDFQYRVVLPPGQVRWVRARWKISRNQQGEPQRVTGVLTDITERKRTEQELRSRQEMLDLAQKAARAVAFEWRIGAGEGQNRWSPDLEMMYGLAPGTYDGTYETWKKLVLPEDWPAVKAAIKRANETGDVAAEYRVRHPNGTVHWLQAKGRTFFDAEAKPVRMVGFMLDVTERRRAEEELRRLERQLRQGQRLEAMGTLAGGIAHDFNNILGAILGYGEMALRDAAKGSRLRRDLDSIMTAGERGRALVEQILAFSRSGVDERVAVHIERVAREALDQLAAKLPANVTIAPRLRAGRAAVSGDPTQVHQVLMNLTTNAVQAMPSGGTLRVLLQTVRVDAPHVATTKAVEAGEYVVLEVADSGIGMSPETLERIFDPFFTTKEVGVGTGLGLSLVHGIVAELGGAIEVASVPGSGSTFTVYLPRAGDAAEVDESETPDVPRGNRERVLVVDDEEALVRIATETLEALGYRPVGFTSSAAALEAFRADPLGYDAVDHRRAHARHVGHGADPRGTGHARRYPHDAHERLRRGHGGEWGPRGRRRRGAQEAAFWNRARREPRARTAPRTGRRALTPSPRSPRRRARRPGKWHPQRIRVR